jgi:hypothetical protein
LCFNAPKCISNRVCNNRACNRDTTRSIPLLREPFTNIALPLTAANHPDVMDKVKVAGGVYFDMNLEETQAWQKRIQSRWNNIVQETGIKLDK